MPTWFTPASHTSSPLSQVDFEAMERELFEPRAVPTWFTHDARLGQLSIWLEPPSCFLAGVGEGGAEGKLGRGGSEEAAGGRGVGRQGCRISIRLEPSSCFLAGGGGAERRMHGSSAELAGTLSHVEVVGGDVGRGMLFPFSPPLLLIPPPRPPSPPCPQRSTHWS